MRLGHKKFASNASLFELVNQPFVREDIEGLCKVRVNDICLGATVITLLSSNCFETPGVVSHISIYSENMLIIAECFVGFGLSSESVDSF